MAYLKVPFAVMFAGVAAGVKLDLYYEADCPFSDAFFANDMGTGNTDPACFDQVDINFVPYGNAHEEGPDTSCQHGEDECFGNRLHLCAIDKFCGGIEQVWSPENKACDNKNELRTWIICHMTNLVPEGKQSHDRATYEGCNPDAAWTNEVEQCASDAKSQRWLVMAGDKTRQAAPQSVPWIISQKTPGYNLQSNFLINMCSEMETDGLGQPQCCVIAKQNSAFGRRLLV